MVRMKLRFLHLAFLISLIACGGGGDDDGALSKPINISTECLYPGIPSRTTEYKNGAYSSVTKWYESKKLACTTECLNYGKDCSTSSYKY